MLFRNCGGNKSNMMGAYTNAPGSNMMGAYTNAPGSNVMGAYTNAPGSNVMGASTKGSKSNTMGAYGHMAGHSTAPMSAGVCMNPPQTAPAQYDPTQQYVQTNVTNTIIPVIHPSHTTIVNKHCNTYKHYFPHTQSVVNECYSQQLICGAPVNPCCPPHHGF